MSGGVSWLSSGDPCGEGPCSSCGSPGGTGPHLARVVGQADLVAHAGDVLLHGLHLHLVRGLLPGPRPGADSARAAHATRHPHLGPASKLSSVPGTKQKPTPRPLAFWGAALPAVLGTWPRGGSSGQPGLTPRCPEVLRTHMGRGPRLARGPGPGTSRQGELCSHSHTAGQGVGDGDTHLPHCDPGCHSLSRLLTRSPHPLAQTQETKPGLEGRQSQGGTAGRAGRDGSELNYCGLS